MATVEAGPKYIAVAGAIEAQVHAGHWDGGRLPSVREVASSHGVSVVTASRALQVLRDKGLIRTVERSGCYRIPPAGAERWALCLRLTPGPWRPLTEGLVRDGFEALARRTPMVLDPAEFDIKPGLTAAAAEAQAAAALAGGLTGVVLLPNRVCDAEAAAERAFVAGCRAAGLPVCLIERAPLGPEGGPLPCDLVSVDDYRGGAEATRHLLAGGRKRGLAGYLTALHLHDPARTPVVLHAPHDPDPQAGHRALADGVVKHRLDAVVCYSDYAAVGLIVELLHRGRAVPGDVAVVGFDDLPVGGFLPSGLTTYAYPAEAMAELAVRALRDRRDRPDRPATQTLVPGQLIARGSTGAGP
jgi:LacI family transcriptional regulator